MLTLDVLGTMRTFTPDTVVIAGFTGRDREAVEAHLKELDDLGVPTPQAIPTFYEVPTDLLVQDGGVATVHANTSGEVEVVLVVDGGETFVGLGSDHTDRAAEELDIGLSKGLCRKPMSTEFWPYELIADRLDQMEIRSWIVEGGTEVLYQSGRLSEILPLGDLLDHVPFVRRSRSFVLFTGTVQSIGGIRGSESFRAELFDPHTRARIALNYRIDVQNRLFHPSHQEFPTDAHGGAQ